LWLLTHLPESRGLTCRCQIIAALSLSAVDDVDVAEDLLPNIAPGDLRALLLRPDGGDRNNCIVVVDPSRRNVEN